MLKSVPLFIVTCSAVAAGEALMFFVYLFFWIFEPLPVSSPVAEAYHERQQEQVSIAHISCRVEVFKSYLLMKTFICLLFSTLMSVACPHQCCVRLHNHVTDLLALWGFKSTRSLAATLCSKTRCLHEVLLLCLQCKIWSLFFAPSLAFSGAGLHLQRGEWKGLDLPAQLHPRDRYHSLTGTGCVELHQTRHDRCHSFSCADCPGYTIRWTSDHGAAAGESYLALWPKGLRTCTLISSLTRDRLGKGGLFF